MNPQAQNILIVEPSHQALAALETMLQNAGFAKISQAASAREALEIIGLDQGENGTSGSKVDLLLLDIAMPDMDGIEVCRLIKDSDKWPDLPIVMLTAQDDMDGLTHAFEAGALDCVIKPVQEMELLARIRSALKLKEEVERRKSRERDLLEITAKLTAANQRLRALSSRDGLTGVANRRWFDECLEREWRRSLRNQRIISLLFIDIDYFKNYNDHYGHLSGDECLQQVAQVLKKRLHRAGDLVARYGGEEFVVLMPETEPDGARELAHELRSAVEELGIPHEASEAAGVVTVSIGGCSLLPSADKKSWYLVDAADQAMYRAKKDGRNRIRWDVRAPE